MEIQELIKYLRDMLPEPIDYAEMVGAPGWAYGHMYAYENPEDRLISDAAELLEKLYDENQQLTRKFDDLLKDFQEFILNTDDACNYCKHNQTCHGKECEQYVEGKGAWDQKGYISDWQWSCEDFNFGTCPKLENTPCNGCIKNNMQGFEWRGM